MIRKRISQAQIDQIALGLCAGRRMTGKCCICGHKVYSKHSIYCRRCYLFSRRMNQRGLHADAVRSIWKWVRQHGFVCYYTGMELDLKNPKSPRYYEFDHWIPGDDRKIVLTSVLINTLKSVLLEKEFWRTVEGLADYKRTGAKFKMGKLVYWERQGPHEKLT